MGSLICHGGPVTNETFDDIGLILSVRDGHVWATWPDDRAAVCLGDQDKVLATMRVFINATEIREGLERNDRTGGKT